MKNRNLGSITALGLSLLLTVPAFAAEKEGTHTGGGGGNSEIRFNEVRSDIVKWLSEGGAKGLVMPQGITEDTYVSGMFSMLAPHAVVVGFVTTEQENSTNDPELRVYVDGQPKDCRGFQSTKGKNQLHILCNSERFAAVPEAGQYRLIHHEYAGLAGLEENVGASSDYRLSTQLTSFLQEERVLRLAVKRREGAPEAKDIYDFDCVVSAEIRYSEEEGFPALMKGSRIGAGVVFTEMSGGDHSFRSGNLELTLSKRNGKFTTLPVKLTGVEFGATAALEIYGKADKSISLNIDPDRCVKAIDLFKPFYGTGASVGAAVAFGVDLEIAGLWNGKGYGLTLGLGTVLVGVGVHANVLPLKIFQIKPGDGFYSLDRSFFNSDEIENRVNGVRDIKW